MFACPAVPPSPPPRIDRPRYEVNVHIDSDLKEVSGDLTVRFTPNRPTQRLVFRLWPNGPLQEREGTRLDVGDATAGGHTLHAARPDPTTLVLRAQLRAGETIAVHLPWRLHVPMDARDRVSRFPAGVRLGSFFPILAWDPRRGWVTDPPAKILAESSTTPASDFDVRVDAPSGMEALVSGTRVAPDHWHAHGVRDVAVAVGRFSVFTAIARAPRPVTVVVGVARSAQVGGPNVLRMAVRALERLSRLYGAYPWKTYTVVVPPDLHSVGIEYPTLSFIGASPILRVIVDHETAHQWFYSLVGNDQARDPWLDEALATWGQLQLGSGLPGSIAVSPSSEFQHVGASMSYWNTRQVAYFREVYGGGVVALASLGPARRVNCALHHYAARNAYGIAQPRDLLDALNRVIPGAERRLRRFGIRR
ncbi:MAG: M1 family aminopeptidase [Gaiellaceae bacterium]